MDKYVAKFFGAFWLQHIPMLASSACWVPPFIGLLSADKPDAV